MFETERERLVETVVVVYQGILYNVVAHFDCPSGLDCDAVAGVDWIKNGERTPALQASATRSASRMRSSGSDIAPVECNEPKASCSPHPTASKPWIDSPT